MIGAARTHMAREVAEIPQIVARQIDTLLPLYLDEGRRWKADRPLFFATCARGTSDHAANYFKYLTETRLGVPVVSLGPTLGSIYQPALQLDRAVMLTISQSGASPDLLALQAAAAAGGARTVALLNTPQSPVGSAAMQVLPIGAGLEHAVAATKSFVASLVALAALHAAMADDSALIDALRALPESLDRALRQNLAPLAAPIAQAQCVVVLGRGTGLAIAREAALKLKETCLIPAEAYSAAEFRHGPMALARAGVLALVFAPDDGARQGTLETVTLLRQTGAEALIVAATDPGQPGPEMTETPHPMLTPLIQITAFYRFVAELAVQLGQNPDSPPHLLKATETV